MEHIVVEYMNQKRPYIDECRVKLNANSMNENGSERSLLARSLGESRLRFPLNIYTQELSIWKFGSRIFPNDTSFTQIQQCPLKYYNHI